MPSQEFVTFAREEWIPALRSDAFRQGTSALHLIPYEQFVVAKGREPLFCCIGIACFLHPHIVEVIPPAESRYGKTFWYTFSELGEPVSGIPFDGSGVSRNGLPAEIAKRWDVTTTMMVDILTVTGRGMVEEGGHMELPVIAKDKQPNTTLAALNDIGMTFDLIANVAEAALEEVHLRFAPFAMDAWIPTSWHV